MKLALRQTTHIVPDGSRLVLYDDDRARFPSVRFIDSTSGSILCLIHKDGSLQGAAQTLTELVRRPIDHSNRLVDLVFNRFAAHFEEVSNSANSDRHTMISSVLGHRHKITGELNTDPRLEHPVQIAWIPTWNCRSECVYCSVGASRGRRKDPKPHVSLDHMLDVFAEAQEIGVTSILVHGGEPLLYPSLLRAIQGLKERGFHVLVSTRERVNAEDAKALHDAGLNQIQVSIDTFDQHTTELLHGHRSTVDDLKTTILSFQNADVRVLCNTLLTALNIRTVPSLLRELCALGVGRSVLSWYQRSPLAMREDLLACEDDKSWLHEEIMSCKPEILPSMELCYQPWSSAHARSVCSGGREALVILPDGQVSICDRLAHDSRFRIGDVTTQSLLSIWNSQSLQNLLYPGREPFAGEQCHDCADFEMCQRLGFCYVRSLVANGRPFASDYNCQRVGQPPSRLD